MMAEPIPIPDVMRHSSVPFCSLCTSTRHALAWQLNPKRNTISPHTRRLQDWRGLAEIFGFSQLDVDNFDRMDNPTVEILSVWLRENAQATIGDFLRGLIEIERYDIVHCESLQADFGEFCQ